MQPLEQAELLLFELEPLSRPLLQQSQVHFSSRATISGPSNLNFSVKLYLFLQVFLCAFPAVVGWSVYGTLRLRSLLCQAIH